MYPKSFIFLLGEGAVQKEVRSSLPPQKEMLSRAFRFRFFIASSPITPMRTPVQKKEYASKLVPGAFKENTISRGARVHYSWINITSHFPAPFFLFFVTLTRDLDSPPYSYTLSLFILSLPSLSRPLIGHLLVNQFATLISSIIGSNINFLFSILY